MGREVIRLGTRKSRLAMVQAELAAAAIRKAASGVEIELVPLVTTGDKILDRSLVEFGGKGVFIDEFELAIADGRIDAAVHSAKDMPACLMDGLSIAAVLKREDPRDVFVTAKKRETCHSPFVIGTGSLRRQLQIAERKDGVCRLLRGNVNTRLEKLFSGEYDAVILAAAGLKRLGLLEDERFSFEFLPETEFVPAGGQGIIALESRKDSRWQEVFDRINDREAFVSLLAERKVLSLLSAGCNAAVGVYSWREGGEFHMKLMREEGGRPVYTAVSGQESDYEALAASLIDR
jgi:hydroxymethylbilane synthase